VLDWEKNLWVEHDIANCVLLPKIGKIGIKNGVAWTGDQITLDLLGPTISVSCVLL